MRGAVFFACGIGGVGGHKCPPAGRSQKGWRGTREKRKAPKEKSPQQKKRKRCLRLLLLTGGCAALLSCFSPPLASSYGGCAAPHPLFSPLSCLSFTLLLWRLRRHLPAPLSCSFFLPSPRLSRLLWGLRRPYSSPRLSRFFRAAAPPPLSSLSSFLRQRFTPPPLALLSP